MFARLRAWLWRSPDEQDFGRRGEQLAIRYLRRLGYKIIHQRQRNWGGEIDIVAIDGRTVVFVEVKTRASQEAGHPADAIDIDKRRRLTRAALAFLKAHQLLDYATRFDVVAVTWREGLAPEVEHFRAAFDASGHDSLYS